MSRKPRRRSNHRPDRTKYRATPPRSADRRIGRKPPIRVSVALLLFLSVIGAAFLLVGLLFLTELRAQHHSPELSMTVSRCRTVHHDRGRTIDCIGTGRPGGSGVTAGTWRFAGAPEVYADGTVLRVRCTPDGECNRLTVGRHALALFLTLAGAAVTVLGLSLAARQVVGAVAPHRLPGPLSRPGTAAVAALLLVLAGSLVYVFT
ncbi:hypothetical protein ACI1MP_35890 [Kitasatospora griseola]|uniref:hypothetical protein n=1 Tax=Kitasatospora griseola TaxID=2064 RepID=UPI00385579F6